MAQKTKKGKKEEVINVDDMKENKPIFGNN